MSVDDFFAANPGISREKVENVEVLENPEPLGNETLFDATNVGCSLVFVREEGAYSLMRAEVYSCVIVTLVRGGRVTGRITHSLLAGNQLYLMSNNDGQNYDGYVCC